MRGIILAGGEGTRLKPLTLVANKHLLPVYNKPMILYPLETLKSFSISDILIVSGGEHIGRFAEFLGDGSDYGVNLTYKVQRGAGGIAQALGLAEDFADDDRIMVILGDNIFENDKIPRDDYPKENAVLFFKEVGDPGRFGVPVFKDSGELENIEEKPKVPKSKYAVTGLYSYPSTVFDIIKTLKPSGRGELEITDVNKHYIKVGKCSYEVLDGFWSDAGTFESLFRSSSWIWSREKDM